MSLQRFIFVAIDKLLDGAQNKRISTRFKGIDFDIERDIPYDSQDKNFCLLDVCRVKKDGKYPVLFYIHGGGFVAGDKHHRRAVCRWYATLGYFVVNVNYGLCPACKCPMPQRQLINALNWVGDNAEKYNLDTSRIVVAGDSSGAYFAACLACLCDNIELQQKLGVHTALRFAAALLNCGVFNLKTILSRRLPFNLGKRLYKDYTGEELKDAANFKWAELCCLPELVTPSFPPCFITYSRKDIFCRGQSDEFAACLRKIGVPCREFCSEKFIDNHCFSLNWIGKAAKKNNELTMQFLKEIANT